MADSLSSKIVALHDSLEAAKLPHAFGGALALAYCVAEPRATMDIDLNVFIEPDRLDELLAALPAGVSASASAKKQLLRDAQARTFWGHTPVDLFLSNHPFHEAIAANVRIVPFGDAELPVLACKDLAVFKALFDRPKDAVDVAAMLSVGAIDVGALEEVVSSLLRPGERQRFFDRVREFASS